MTNIGDIPAGGLIPGTAISTLTGHAVGSAGSQVLNRTQATIGGLSQLLTSTGFYYVIGQFDFLFSDQDISNKENVHFGGFMYQDGVQIGEPAYFYASAALDSRGVVHTQALIGVVSPSTLTMKAYAERDDATDPLANRATCTTPNTGFLWMKL